MVETRVSVHVYIQEFHFRPRNLDTCLPCDCYPVGSFSRACDPESGQCQCRPGVIGRQCNSCDNPFAEVTNSGCEGEKKKQVNWVCNLCLFIFSLFSLKKEKRRRSEHQWGLWTLSVCAFIVIFLHLTVACWDYSCLHNRGLHHSLIHSSVDVKLRITSQASPLAGEKNQINK